MYGFGRSKARKVRQGTKTRTPTGTRQGKTRQGKARHGNGNGKEVIKERKGNEGDGEASQGCVMLSRGYYILYRLCACIYSAPYMSYEYIYMYEYHTYRMGA